MSKISTAVIEAEERLGKELEELEGEDLSPDEYTSRYISQVIWEIECNVHDINAYRGDLSFAKEDLDKIIAQLTKLLGRIQ